MHLGADADLLAHWHTMVRACRGMLDTPEDAEDCASRALLQVLSTPGEAPRHPEAYLIQVARRRAADQLRMQVRARRRALRLAHHADEQVVDIAESIVDKAEARWLEDVADQLPEDTRAVLNTLAAGATPAEAAEQLGLTKRAVESHLLRARRALKAAWRQTLGVIGLLWGARSAWRTAPAFTVAAAAFVLPLIAVPGEHGGSASVDVPALTQGSYATPAVPTAPAKQVAVSKPPGRVDPAAVATPKRHVVHSVDSPAGAVVRVSKEDRGGPTGAPVEEVLACVEDLTVSAHRVGC